MTRPGESFRDADVAQAYLQRPDYAAGVYRKLIEICPGHRSLLDLGCGTGKISRRLSGHFESVTAIDPSGPMLHLALSQDAAEPDRIHWIQGRAEEAHLDGAPFDLVVAAASIHWMDHAIVFPRLLTCVTADHVLAVVDGDGACDPPWDSAWHSFLARWIPELNGEPYEPDRPDSSYMKRMNGYRRWLDVTGETAALSEPVSQSIGDFIECQHSRDTFAAAKLGPRLTRFDEELRALLTPYASGDMLSYQVQSDLVWGTIRHEPGAVHG